MTMNPNSPTLYFDECAKVVPKVLRRMAFNVADSMKAGTPDAEWLRHAGREGYVVITRDVRITQNPEEMRTLVDNNVKCFILPGERENAWDLVRSFVMMWDKIRTESLLPGPFVWRFHDAREHVRWEQLYPEPRRSFGPLDLSRVPVGHLLNLFADVVHQLDDGWFSESCVNALHENIRRELEARIARDRSLAMTPAEAQLQQTPSRCWAAGQKYRMDLGEPLDTASDRIVVIRWKPEDAPHEYPWLFPARRLREASADETQIVVRGAPVGFHRSGLGLRLRAKRP